MSKEECVVQVGWQRYQLRRAQAATQIKAAWKGYLARMHMTKIKAAFVLVQARWRGLLARRAYRRTVWAVTRIQAACRDWQARLLLQRTQVGLPCRHIAPALSVLNSSWQH